MAGYTLAERGAETLDETTSHKVEEAVAKRLGDTWAMWRTRHWSIR